MLAMAIVLLGVGTYAVLAPRGHFNASFHYTTLHITPSQESNRTVVDTYPDPVLLEPRSALHEFSVTFSNPTIASYASYQARDRGPYYHAIDPQNLGQTEVTITWGTHTTTLTLVVKGSKDFQ
jgi:hypothetical protein